MSYRIVVKWESGGENVENIDHDDFKTVRSSLQALAKNPTYQKGNRVLQLESVSVIEQHEEKKYEFPKDDLVALFG